MPHEIDLNHFRFHLPHPPGPTAPGPLAGPDGSPGQQKRRAGDRFRVQRNGMPVGQQKANSTLAAGHNVNGGFKNPVAKSSAHEA